MHTLGTRANAIVYYGALILLACLAANVASSYFFSRDIEVSLKLNKIEKIRRERGNDRAGVYFDLSADLRPLFNWNCKQLFVFVTAEYVTQKHTKNQVVLWDKIVRNVNESNIAFSGMYNKYILQDFGFGLLDNSITLTFTYNYMPITGVLQWNATKHETFKLPKEYF